VRIEVRQFCSILVRERYKADRASPPQEVHEERKRRQRGYRLGQARVRSSLPSPSQGSLEAAGDLPHGDQDCVQEAWLAEMAVQDDHEGAQAIHAGKLRHRGRRVVSACFIGEGGD